MKMIIGLGNPGKEYENTRHNIGFMIIDQYIANENWQKKFDGLFQIINVCGEKVLFLKPLTFMNLSGNAVIKAMKYYDIFPEDILVIHDDMDIPFGRFKLKKNSSSGGHNGIKSIITSIHTEDFSRLKIGISHASKNDTVNYVLGKFSKEEMNFIHENSSLFSDIIESFVKDGIAITMNKYNG